jgi:hypothetical protein
LPQTNLRKNLLEIIILLFVHHWILRFWRRNLAVFLGFRLKFDLEMKIHSDPQKMLKKWGRV